MSIPSLFQKRSPLFSIEKLSTANVMQTKNKNTKYFWLNFTVGKKKRRKFFQLFTG